VNLGDVADEDGAAVDLLDGDIVEGRDDIGAAVETDGIISGADLRRPVGR
jgi:hypothetical protein